MSSPEMKAAELAFMGAAIFQALPDPHFIIDELHKIRHINEAACVSFGYDHDELVDQDVSILVPDAKKVEHAEYVAGYMRSPRMRPMGVGLVVQARRKSGRLVPVEVSLSPVYRSNWRERRIIVRVVFKEGFGESVAT